MQTNTEYRWEIIDKYVKLAIKNEITSDKRWDVIRRDTVYIKRKLKELENK